MAEKEHVVGGNAGLLVSDLYVTVSFPFAESKVW